MDCVQQRWEHHIWMNENFPSMGKQIITNINPPHDGRETTPKKWHYMGH